MPQTFPEMYEMHLVGPMFTPWVGLMLDKLDLKGSESLLDVACGTGIVARIAKRRTSGKIVGIDINQEMIDVARRIEPGIDWRNGDARSLPLLQGELFDLACCQQGLQFMPDKQSALTQMKNALAPGGRFGAAMWRSDEEVPLFFELRAVAERHLGPIQDPRHSVSAKDPVVELFVNSGFEGVECEVHSLNVTFPSAGPLLKMNTMALIGMSASGREMGDEKRVEVAAKIEAESQPVAERFMVGGELVFETRSIIVIASAGPR